MFAVSSMNLLSPGLSAIVAPSRGAFRTTCGEQSTAQSSRLSPQRRLQSCTIRLIFTWPGSKGKWTMLAEQRQFDCPRSAEEGYHTNRFRKYCELISGRRSFAPSGRCPILGALLDVMAKFGNRSKPQCALRQLGLN